MKIMNKLLLCIALGVAMMHSTVQAEPNRHPANQTTIILKTAASELTIQLAGKGAATVQWGDIRTMKIPELAGEDGTFWNKYTHIYSAKGIHVIKITGEGITGLDCGKTKLTALDASGNDRLVYLDCSGNQLTELDVSNNVNLTYLICSGNKLTALDLSKNVKLKSLLCADNRLAALKVSKEAPLSHLMCQRNQLQTGTLNALFETLSRNKIDDNSVNTSDNPGSADCNVAIAESKGRNVDNNFAASPVESTPKEVIASAVPPVNLPKPDFGASSAKAAQKWNLTSTMTAELGDNGWLWINTSLDSEAMPDFDRNNPAPWASVRNSIQSVGIGNKVTTIGSHAFEDCSNLAYITIARSVKSIGKEAFRSCTGLNSVSVDMEKPLRIPDNLFASVNMPKARLDVPTGTVERYQSAKVWRDFGYIDGINLPASALKRRDTPPGVPDTGEFGRFFRNSVGEETMTWCIFLFSVMLFFMRIIKKKGEPRLGISYIVSNTLFLTVSAMEIIYVLSTGSSMWFCTPSMVGWLWTIVNFFLLGGVVYNQVLYGKDVVDDISANGNVEIDINLGILSWGASFIGLIVFGIFFKAGIPWVFRILGILQVIQCILIFRVYGKNWKSASFAVFAYLLGSAGIAAMLTVLIGILIFAAMGLAVLWLVLKTTGGGDGDRSSAPGERGIGHCDTCRYYHGGGQYCEKGEKHVDHYTPACTEYIRD
jgi:hypothetical protein